MSRWGGELTRAEAECMRASGIHTVIVATGPGGYGLMALQQAEMAHAVGLRVEAYVFLEFESDPEWWVREAVMRLEQAPYVARWWLDIEDIDHGKDWSVQHRREYADAAIMALDAMTGMYSGVYTGGWFWRPYMGDWRTFANENRPLWNSYYDGYADVDGLPYGGWDAMDVAIEQYQGTTDVCGQSVDLNYMWIEPEVPDVEDENLLLALFAGGEERGPDNALKPREERLRLARIRRDAAANGIDTEGNITPSVRELAASAHAAATAL